MANRTQRKRASAKSARAKPIKVMLVDDHPLWRDTLEKVLERQGFATVVAQASDGAAAIEQAPNAGADVIVMDIQLPEKTGIEATAAIVAKDPAARVLVLASSDNRAQVVSAVEAGACGYLIKTASSDDVRDAVRRVHAGELVFPPTLANVVLEQLRGRAKASAVPAEPNRFEREGDFWTVRFDGEIFRLKDTRGVRFLSQLLHEPGREFHALDIVGTGRGAPPERSDAGPVLDAQAKAAYRARMRDLQQELGEAEEWDDVERATLLREEIAALESAVASAVGLGGRDRRAASNAERARVNVTLAIRSTMSKIEEYSPALFEHLSSSVKTGTYCSYTPDPRAPITWL